MTSQLKLKFSNTSTEGQSESQPATLASLGPQLDRLRDELCDVDEKMLAGEIAIPAAKRPLGTGFIRLPERLLAEYEAGRAASSLGRMLTATKQLMSEVDRVVVLAGSEYLSGARAVMQACCQPYFNQLSRGERGSRPKLLLAGASLDNDEVQGTLHLLGAHRNRAASTLHERWGLVVIGRGNTSAAVRQLLPIFQTALQVNVGGDLATALSRTLLVTDPSDPLEDLNGQLSEDNRFHLPTGVVPRFSALSMPGLLIAALLGINIMQLLEGARQISRHFSTTKAGDNLVLQLAGWNHLIAARSAAPPPAWVAWSQALAETGNWYRQLLSGSLGKQLVVADPLEIEPRIYSSLQHSGEGKTSFSRPWLTQVATERFRFDPLPLGQLAPQLHYSQLQQTYPYQSQGVRPGTQELADKPLCQLTVDESEDTLIDALHRVYQRTQHALLGTHWPTVELLLPQIDEASVGQLLQLLMLATVVEARLTSSNPFK